MRNFLIILFTLLIICSCASIKEVPVQTIEKVIYHDSLIYIVDSVEVKVPYEIIKNKAIPTDTSYLKTSLAESIAYVDTTNNKLYHTLTQNGRLKAKVDTVIKVEYVDKLIEKDVPVEVEVIKYKYNTFFWLLLVWFTLSIIYLARNIYNKIKK